MHGGDTAIPGDGYSDTNYTCGINYWFYRCTFIICYDITTVNIQDNQVYDALTSSSSLPSTTLKKTHYMIADHAGYDDQYLYDLSMALGFQLVCPVRRYREIHQKKDWIWLISMNQHWDR